MAESDTVWVPTAATVRNLLGSGRFSDGSVFEIYERLVLNMKTAYAWGVRMALGSDAGAYPGAPWTGHRRREPGSFRMFWVQGLRLMPICSPKRGRKNTEKILSMPETTNLRHFCCL